MTDMWIPGILGRLSPNQGPSPTLVNRPERTDPKPFHLEIQTAARQPQQAGTLGDIARGSFERRLDHLAFDFLDRGSKRRLPVARPGCGIDGKPAGAERRRQQLRSNQARRWGHRHRSLYFVAKLADVAGPRE